MAEPLLELLNISKAFSGVQALRQVSLSLRAGEVLALVGENGAGKSTLLKILAGVQPADEGEIRIDGQPVRIGNPHAAQKLGIAMIHQELQQVPELTVAQNLFLGAPEVRAGVWLDRARMHTESRRVLARLDDSIDPDRPIKQLRVAQRQIVEIGRALLRQARIVAMDEPTSSLTPQEFVRLKEIIRLLQQDGVGIIYVSHKFEEIRQVCGRATVLRDGVTVGSADLADTPDSGLVRMMVGRTLDAETHVSHVRPQETVLRVNGVRWRKMVTGASFELRHGEILGVAGLIGSGRTELVRLIAGLERPEAGTIEIHGRPRRLRSRRDGIRAGVGLVPEDRKREAIVPQRPVFLNVGLPRLRQFSPGYLLRESRLRQSVRRLTESVRLRPPDVNRSIRLLSGGNQQKAIICRWLLAKSDILILDEPTRGVDVGAKAEIYRLMEKLASEGRAIIAVSSELPEILRISDRVLIMRAGAAPVMLEREGLTEEIIMRHAVAAKA